VLVHLRLTVPSDLGSQVCRELVDQPCVTNLTYQQDVVVSPAGDLLECDVAREQAGEVLRLLEDLGVSERGSVVVTSPSSTPFREARRIEAAAPGHPDDAVIWDSVESQAYAGAVPTVSFHLFLLLAVVLAAIAVVTDSAILVIGAMVVGPEFGAIAAACAGIALGRWNLLWASLRLLVLAFTFAIVVTTVLAVVGTLTGLLTLEDVTRPRPNTGFIWHPDRWSFIVAVVAGAAGALALAIERSSAMVGVFISVTTVPAAGNLALGLALLDGGEIVGSLAQLGVNVAGMVVAGTLVLLLVRTSWPWVMARSESWFSLGRVRPGSGSGGAR